MIIVNADSRSTLEKLASTSEAKTFEDAFPVLWRAARDSRATVDHARLAMRDLSSRGIGPLNEGAMADFLVKSAAFEAVQDWWRALQTDMKGDPTSHKQLVLQALQAMQALSKDGLLHADEKGVIDRMVLGLRAMLRQDIKMKRDRQKPGWNVQRPAFRFGPRQQQQAKPQQVSRQPQSQPVQPKPQVAKGLVPTPAKPTTAPVTPQPVK